MIFTFEFAGVDTVVRLDKGVALEKEKGTTNNHNHNHNHNNKDIKKKGTANGYGW